MKCEVIAAIRGLQFLEEEEGEQVEVITPAQYYLRNGVHYLIYEEVDEDNGARTKNTLKYKDHSLELIRKGAVNAHLVFEEQKKNVASYGTPFGNILIGIDTGSIFVEEEEKRIHVEVAYTLEANYQYLADCRIEMNIQSREEGMNLL